MVDLGSNLTKLQLYLDKRPSINYVVSRVEGGGQKLQILHSKKKTTNRGRGSKIPDFEAT